jgi:hypothetical protein
VADVCKPSHNPYSVAFTHLHPVRELLWRAYGPVLLAAASGESVKTGGRACGAAGHAAREHGGGGAGGAAG